MNALDSRRMAIINSGGLGRLALWLLPLLAICMPNTGVAQEAEEFFATDVSEYVEPCFACHLDGGVADSRGARLILNNSGAQRDQDNYDAFFSFYSLPDVDSALILAKISGGAGHGGAQVHARGSSGYVAIEDLLSLIGGEVAGGDGPGDQDFWRGLVLEPRAKTLRRASILLAGKLPTNAQMNHANKSNANLRASILKVMNGSEFHRFLINGANDRLHTDGFLNGMFFEFGLQGHYPKANVFNKLDDCEIWDADTPRKKRIEQATTLTDCNVHSAVTEYGLIREPLELIAHVVQRNLSYKQVLTANFAMVNRYTAHAYGAHNVFPKVQPGEPYDPWMPITYKRASDKGQAHLGDGFFSECDPDCRVIEYASLINRPHAGVLTTPAWLARYPTTDTNRNRARARWTFYHFLGVDIEKSAPRTTDPDALADNNNPTMNNPACTVCHERMDPVAGAYQNYGDFGTYRNKGYDSLADTYKYPEWFGGEPGDTPYQEGDTWYRDMRKPGINGKTTAKKHGSLKWLAQQITADPRFAKATVAFWWPAIMGADPLEAPESSTDATYEQQLNAYNAQQVLMDELAAKFRTKQFKAKQLFADMIMSPWFRASAFEGDDLADRTIELASVGSGRLLSPEELDRKAFAIFGARWDESNSPNGWSWVATGQTRLSGGDEKIAYGGIDSFGVTDRARQLNALMSNVAERQAVEFACRVTIWDFNRDKMAEYRKSCSTDPWWETDWERKACELKPPENRPKLFNKVAKTTVPNAANRTKIENQIVELYDRVLGLDVNRSHPEVQQLYALLESRWKEYQQRGWVDNPCWIGSRDFDHLSWDNEADPRGMVEAWSSVMRAIMSHYWYLHE